MTKNHKDNIDIVDALRYSINCSVNPLGRAIKQFTKISEDTAKSFLRFANSIFGYAFSPYHKTKQFRRRMYYRRYFRNSHRSNKSKRKKH